MTRSLFYSFLLSFICTLGVAQVEQPLTRILFIYDASNSMNGRWESDSKHDVAKRLLSQALDSLHGRENVEMALRVYGHQSPLRYGQDCNDTKLEIGFGGNHSNMIRNRLKTITPMGTTPIAQTLIKTENDFPPCTDCRNIIILITDGIEECNGDPCAVSRALQRNGVILKPFVIGIGMDEDFKATFKCIGNYYDATDEKDFGEVLNIVISQALNSTTAQVNLLDVGEEPTETNVSYTLYNQHTGIDVYNHVHTMNSRGLPDTLYVDPVSEYRMVVHTIPQVEVENITLRAGQHNIIPADAGTGRLEVLMNDVRQDIPSVIVRKSGDMNTINAQKVNENERYLVGSYDLEILTLPRTYIYDVNVNQSATTKVEIPAPGLATIMRSTSGYGAIFQISPEGELIWVYNLTSNASSESVYLQPGRYKVVFRPSAAISTLYTKVKEFQIYTGQAVAVQIK